MSDIGYLAQAVYDRGADPLDWAQDCVVALIQVHMSVIVARAEDPAAFPGYSIELTWEALSRRILGELLDAGWTMPEVTPHDPR